MANYAIPRAARDCSDTCDPEAVDTLVRCAYVDDVMRSFSSERRAVEIFGQVRDIAASAGFNLTSIVSNSRQVLESFPLDSLAPEYQTVDLGGAELPHDRVLGILWKVNEDRFSFKIGRVTKPATRRGMLSVVGSLFDPLGLVSPVLVPARALFQQTCSLQLGWDDELPEDLSSKWNR